MNSVNTNESNQNKSNQQRVSLSMVLSFGIPTSRVKGQLESMGLNFPLNQEYNRLLTLSRNQVNDDPNFVNISKEEVQNVFGLQVAENKEFWSTSGFNFKAAVSSVKFRISGDAIVALTAIIDSLTHELSLHAIKQTLAANKCTVINKYLMENVDQLPLFSLFYPLSCYQKMLNDLRNSKDKNNENEENNVETADVQDDECEDEEDSEENNLTALKKINLRTRSFLNFVGKIAQTHIFRDSNEEKTKASLRLSTKFKEFVSDIICEFISTRLTTILRILMKLKDAKTVSDQYIMAAIELMMMDSPVKTNSDSLRKLRSFVDSKMALWKEYNNETKAFNSLEETEECSGEKFLQLKNDKRNEIMERFHHPEAVVYEQPRQEENFPKPVVSSNKLTPQAKNAKTQGRTTKVKHSSSEQQNKRNQKSESSKKSRQQSKQAQQAQQTQPAPNVSDDEPQLVIRKPRSESKRSKSKASAQERNVSEHEPAPVAESTESAQSTVVETRPPQPSQSSQQSQPAQSTAENTQTDQQTKSKKSKSKKNLLNPEFLDNN